MAGIEIASPTTTDWNKMGDGRGDSKSIILVHLIASKSLLNWRTFGSTTFSIVIPNIIKDNSFHYIQSELAFAEKSPDPPDRRAISNHFPLHRTSASHATLLSAPRLWS